MIENNILKDKSIAFAIRTVNCYKFLEKEKNEKVMSKQLLRCGTSIGANIHEGIYGQRNYQIINIFAKNHQEKLGLSLLFII